MSHPASNSVPLVFRYVCGNHNQDVCVILDYVAPFALIGSRPKGAVVYHRKRGSFLRGGVAYPEFHWDVYGDDYGNVTGALAAIEGIREQEARPATPTAGQGG
jgi:hypothetical protein